MRKNLPREGRSPQQTRTLLEEWKPGREILIEGGDYAAYLAATRNLRRDPSVRYFAGDLTGTAEDYAAEQAAFMRNRDDFEFDEDLSIVRVRDFDEILASLDIDVLALFGELDTNVDWQATRALYRSTIGRNDEATLALRTFPRCNHSMNVSETGAVREVEGTPMQSGTKCPGYYAAQLQWLRQYVVPLERGSD